MTKNNLNEHLSWLLQSASTTVDNSTSVRSFGVAELCQPIVGSVLLSSKDETFGSSRPTPARPVVTNLGADHTFAKPNLPASALRALEKDDMARLQSGPKSNNKSRLLSETGVAPRQTTTPSASVGQSNSLSSQYSRGFDGK